MDLVNFMGLTSIDDFARELAPLSKQRKGYICLDSKYARFLANNTKLQWDFMDVLTEGANTTNTTSKIRDITSARMLSIVMPAFNSVPQRASIAIEEFNTQSFLFPNGRRFHFIGLLNNLYTSPVPLIDRSMHYTSLITVPDVTIVNKYELLAGYKFNEGYYRFNKPITNIDTITVSIGNPTDLVTLPVYEYQRVLLAYGGLLGSQCITLTFPEIPMIPGGRQTSVTGYYTFPWQTSIFISGFTTSSPLDPVDAVWITTLNTYEFTTVFSITDNQIVLQTDRCVKPGQASAVINQIVFLPTNGLAYPSGDPSTVTVTFNTNRIIMNFELEYNVE